MTFVNMSAYISSSSLVFSNLMLNIYYEIELLFLGLIHSIQNQVSTPYEKCIPFYLISYRLICL